jgi:hypothetical protein
MELVLSGINKPTIVGRRGDGGKEMIGLFTPPSTRLIKYPGANKLPLHFKYNICTLEVLLSGIQSKDLEVKQLAP